MKKVLKFFAALAAVAGIVYLSVKYVDKILEVVAQIKEKLCELKKCTCEEAAEEVPCCEAPAEATCEEPKEETAEEETPCCCEETAEEAPCCEEAPVDETAVVADEADFEQ